MAGTRPSGDNRGGAGRSATDPAAAALLGVRQDRSPHQSQRQVLRIGRVGLFSADYTTVDFGLYFVGVVLKLDRGRIAMEDKG
jgi:hypothetical protein